MKKQHLTDSCIFLMILLFSYTAVTKFLDQELFVFQLKLSPLPPVKTLAPLLGWFVPLTESLVVAGLLLSSWRLYALYAAVILLTVFDLYITGMLLSGLNLPCTCGGIISYMTWKQHLLFNTSFIGLGLVAIVNIRGTAAGRAPAAGNGDPKEFSRA